MDRRKFLTNLGIGSAAVTTAALVDPTSLFDIEKELWIPGERKIFLPNEIATGTYYNVDFLIRREHIMTPEFKESLKTGRPFILDQSGDRLYIPPDNYQPRNQPWGMQLDRPNRDGKGWFNRGTEGWQRIHKRIHIPRTAGVQGLTSIPMSKILDDTPHLLRHNIRIAEISIQEGGPSHVLLERKGAIMPRTFGGARVASYVGLNGIVPSDGDVKVNFQ